MQHLLAEFQLVIHLKHYKMNELEKTLPENEGVNPQPAVQAETSSPASDTPADGAVLTDSETVEAAETATAEADDANDNALRQKYFDMTKDELAASLKAVVEAKEANRHKEVAQMKQAFYLLRNAELEAEAIRFAENAEPGASFVSEPDPTEAQFKDLLAAFREMRNLFLEEEEQRRAANLTKKHEIIDKLKAIAADIDNINLHIPEVRQLQEDFKAIADIPAGAVNETWKTYQLVIEQIFDCLKMNKELRDLDFKKNLAIKRDLIEQAKLLTTEQDVISAFKKLQALHDLWREAGPVAKEHREEIWNEFKELSTVINKRHQEYFEARKEAEQANEAAKTAICEEIEAIDIDALKSFAAFDEATEAIKKMQARWKELGFASRKANNALFTRFRKSCDNFFARKAEFFTRTKEELAANLEKKTALCEKAEALMNSTDFKKTAEQIVALQAEWKTIGSVARKHSDAIWQRFMTACNTFFDARKKDMSARRHEENENLAAKRLVIEALKAIPADATRQQVIEALKEQQVRWNSIGHVPFKMKDKLYDEYRATMDAVRENFDLRESRARMHRFEEQLAGLSSDERRLAGERNRLARALEQKRNELKTFENNLGFLNIKSKEGNSMLREMEKRTQRIKDDIKELEQKMALLNEKTEKSEN